MEHRVGHTDIAETGVVALRRTTGLEVELVRGRQKDGGRAAHPKPPGDVHIRVTRGRTSWYFEFEVKPWVDITVAGLFAHKFRNRRNHVLITRHANRLIAERLRELGIQFLDTDGNAYLEREDLFVWVQGRKPVERPTARLIGRPFKPAGMQVIFALVCIPGLEQQPFREIAHAAGVALGTVNATFRDLKLVGYLLEGKEIRRRVVRREELFEKWVGIYPQQMRPKHFLGRYAAADPDWWKNADLGRWDALWGGETAVAMETGYLRPEVATIYIEGDPDPLIAQYKLKQNQRGNVEIYRKFWQFPGVHDPWGAVPGPLTYAELMATGEGRNKEAAKDLREKNLGRYLG